MMVQRFGSPPRRKRIACVVLLSGFLGCLPADGRAAGLEMPRGRPRRGAQPSGALQAAAAGGERDSVDLANEIYDAINRLQIERPNISYTELTNVLIAAYCPLVVNAPQLTAAEKWQRMRQFDAILRQHLAADTMPQGSLIIANVPLPPAVYRELRDQAAAVDQTPAQFMAAILARAAGR
jgi:hypothetical protein